MEQFIQGFVDEALQLIDNLDSLLVGIDEQNVTSEEIQEVFRVMHTIKGSAGMFSFKNTEAITHSLEDVFDLIRSDNLKVSTDIINITLKASDVIKDLLSNKDLLSPELDGSYKNILNQIVGFLPTPNIEEPLKDNNSQPIQNQNDKQLLYIKFNPDDDVLKRGLAVPSLLEELTELGKVSGLPFLNNIPMPESFDPSVFYLSWDLFINTKASFEEVEDCFMFYMDNEYKIIPLQSEDLSKNNEFLENCISINKGESTLEQMQLLLNKIIQIETKPESEIIEQPIKKELKKSDTTNNTIKVDASKLDELVTLVSELVTLNSRLQLEANALDNDNLKKTVKSVSKLSKRFRENALDLRLIPVKVLELKMQRLIRDLSKQLNKDIDFIVDGTSTELDKNIIARLEGPIMHLLRNSIDHGLELSEERKKAGKPEKGVVKFISFYSESNVFIQIQDDGKGINPDKVIEKAIEKGLIDSNETLQKNEIFQLLFKPGFSTASSITNVSGRGVGLDVVKSEIMAMRGEIDIESEIGLGTSFTLKLPLTLSIIDTLVTKVNNTHVLIPREFILQTNFYKHDGELTDKIEFNGQLIPCISMRDELNQGENEIDKSHVVIINQNNKQYALLVDKIYGEHQAVVKPLGHYNADNNYFSSASVLGDGSLALILDITKLINSKRSKNKLGKYNLK